MSLPFNNYDQLRCRGNEYVTDQTFNRSFYRFYQNDVYLDGILTDHVTNELIHNVANSTATEIQLNGDRTVIMPCGEQNGNTFNPFPDVFTDVLDTSSESSTYGSYLRKGWQTLIDEQPKNLGGHTLVFRIQKTSGLDLNPDSLIVVNLNKILTFSGFYGGTLIIESPPAYGNLDGRDVQHDYSAVNQRICLKGSKFLPFSISIEKCKCKTIIRQCCICIDHINTTTASDEIPFSNLNTPSGTIYRDNNGKNLGSCATVYNGEWTMLNVRRTLNVVDCADVLIKHCFICY